MEKNTAILGLSKSELFIHLQLSKEIPDGLIEKILILGEKSPSGGGKTIYNYYGTTIVVDSHMKQLVSIALECGSLEEDQDAGIANRFFGNMKRRHMKAVDDEEWLNYKKAA